MAEEKIEESVSEVEKVKKEKDTGAKIQFRCRQSELDAFNLLVSEKGIGNAECFQQLLNNMKLDVSKSKNVDLQGNVNSLKSHLEGIQAIFLNVIDTMECQKSNVANKGVRDNKIFADKISDLEKQNKLLEIQSIENKKILVEKDILHDALTEKYNTSVETLNDKVSISKTLSEKNKVLEIENLELKKVSPDLITCKEKLETANVNIVSTAKENKDLKAEIADLNAKNKSENAFLERKLQLDLKGGLLEQRIKLKNEFDDKLAKQEKISDEKFKTEISDLYKHQGVLFEQIQEYGKKEDKLKEEIATLNNANGKKNKDLEVTAVADKNQIDVFDQCVVAKTNETEKKSQVVGKSGTNPLDLFKTLNPNINKEKPVNPVLVAEKGKPVNQVQKNEMPPFEGKKYYVNKENLQQGAMPLPSQLE